MKEKTGFRFDCLILALLCSFLLSIGILVLITNIFYATGVIPVWLMFVAFVLFSYWFYKCKSIKGIIGRTFIVLSLESFAFPVVLFIFSIGMAAKGSFGFALGGGILTIIFSFLSFFFGLIMLVIGILILNSVKKETHISGMITKSGKVKLKSTEQEGE